MEACQVLIANGATLPLGRLLLRGAKGHSSGASQAAVCAAWALSNILFSCPAEVCSRMRRWLTLYEHTGHCNTRVP